MIEEDLRTLMKATPAIAGHVGARINWNQTPQGQPLPAVVLHLISGAPGFTMSGPDSAAPYIVQMDCWATTNDSAIGIARSIKTALNGYKSGEFQGIFLESERDASDEATETIFGRSLDFRVWHNSEATP